jgi:hypothetical protein
MPIAIMLVPLIGFFALIAWELFGSLRTLEVRMRGGGVVSRQEKPTLFWVLIAGQCWVLALTFAFLMWVIFVVMK